MDYRKCAQEIYDLVGKRENLVSAAHCATRLRLVTADNSKVNIKKLEDVDGVKGVFSSNGQLQIILGTGTVNKVYDEFLSISGMSAATKADVKAAAAAKQTYLPPKTTARLDTSASKPSTRTQRLNTAFTSSTTARHRPPTVTAPQPQRLPLTTPATTRSTSEDRCL